MEFKNMKVFYKYKIPQNSLLVWEVCVIQKIINLVKQEFLRQNIVLESPIWEIFFFNMKYKKKKNDFLLKGLCL